MTSERTGTELGAGSTRRAWLGGAAAIVLAEVVACGVLAPRADEPHPLAFDHKQHVEGANTPCELCHEPDPETGKASLPKLESCQECHEDEPTQAYTDYVAALSKRPAEQLWVLYSPDPEVIFSHGGEHAKLACAGCHGDVAGSRATDATVKPRMDGCVECHRTQAKQALDCADCHRETRRDVAPRDHREQWRWEHGQRARFGDLDASLQGDCRHCHTRDTCLECHRQVQPRDHDQFFRIRGHGLKAANDRESCVVCHRQDMCVRCHQTTRPGSHRGSFGGTTSRHCVSCHLPVQETSCSVCHPATPSHALAPPKSPRHPPGLNCRQCHGSTASLPHADNGTDCNACHP